MTRSKTQRSNLMQHMTRALLVFMGLLFALFAYGTGTTLAADAPDSAETIDLSPQVADALNGIIDQMNAQKFAEADAAMQDLRATLQDMNAYEELRTLQLSANLNIMQKKYPEAIADHEAMLALGTLSEAERLATADLTAQLYLQVQDWQKGLEHLLEVNKLQGETNRDTLSRIAYVYNQLGKPADALPFMEKSISLAGADVTEDDYNTLAQAYMGAGDDAKAIATYQKLLEIAPDTSRRENVHHNLAVLYLNVGNRVKAMSTLRMLLREYPTSSQAAAWRQSLALAEMNR